MTTEEFVSYLPAAVFVNRAQNFLGPNLQRWLTKRPRIRRVSHSRGTARALFDLIPQVGQHRTRQVRIFLFRRPGERGNFVLPGQRHQLVP